MANISKAEREKRAAEPKETEMASDLVRMVKGEDSLDVHPTCIKAHESAGWKRAD